MPTDASALAPIALDGPVVSGRPEPFVSIAFIIILIPSLLVP